MLRGNELELMLIGYRRSFERETVSRLERRKTCLSMPRPFGGDTAGFRVKCGCEDIVRTMGGVFRSWRSRNMELEEIRRPGRHSHWSGWTPRGYITAFLKRMEVWHRVKEELMPGCVCTWNSGVSIFSDRQIHVFTECTVYFSCRGVFRSR